MTSNSSLTADTYISPVLGRSVLLFRRDFRGGWPTISRHGIVDHDDATGPQVLGASVRQIAGSIELL